MPFLGVFIYVIVRGKSMGERDMAQAQAQQEAFKTYVQQTASTGSTADELAKLAELMNSGATHPDPSTTPLRRRSSADPRRASAPSARCTRLPRTTVFGIRDDPRRAVLMNTMRNYLAFWVAGLLAGMILMERWHRSAAGPEPSNSEAIQSHVEASPTVKPKAPMDVSNLVNLVVTEPSSTSRASAGGSPRPGRRLPVGPTEISLTPGWPSPSGRRTPMSDWR